MIELDEGSLKTYWTTLESACLFDLSNHGLLACVGKDAGQFLHNLCTNEILKLSAGRAAETFLTTAQAKIVDHVWILNRNGSEPTYYIDAGENQGPRIFQHLDRFLISEQLEITNLTDNFTHFHLAGPQSEPLLSAAFGVDTGSLEPLQAVEVAKGDQRLLIWRRNRLGVIGFDLLCDVSAREQWLSGLANLPVQPLFNPANECLRIEAGLPKFGVDISEGNLPQEVNRIEQTISFTKGCYIGQETVARVRSFGHVNRTLCGLVLSESAGAEAGGKLFRDGAEVGTITSCAISPRLSRAIAMSYIRRGHEEPGTTLRVGQDEAANIATVTKMPFVDFVSNTAESQRNLESTEAKQ